PILYHRRKQREKMTKRPLVTREDRAIELLSRFIPGMMDEISGLQDALELSFEEALREFGGYYLVYSRSGCSILSEQDVFVRNYDSHSRGYEVRFVSYHQTDSRFATRRPSMQITCRMDGMNEKGLVMGYNYINIKNSLDVLVCNIIRRMILETCADVEDAIEL